LPQQIKIDNKEGEWWKNDSPASGRQESRDFLKCSCRQFCKLTRGYKEGAYGVSCCVYGGAIGGRGVGFGVCGGSSITTYKG